MSSPEADHPATPQTFFVDFADLEAKMTASARQRDVATPNGRRMLTSVDEETKKVRANVQDAARAVVTWVAAVCEHDGDQSLDDILADCLRPGPDVQRLNYTALARRINDALDLDLTPKRVKTAVNQLRRSREAKAQTMTPTNIKQKLDALHDRLENDYQALLDAETDDRTHVRREIGIEILGTVRRAAGRLIENDFGEGIPDAVDIDDLEGRFLDFVRDIVTDASRPSLQGDLGKLLVALVDYDGSTECDMRLVVDGARVVNDLLGPDTLAGLMAQLNVLVAGRSLLDSELYVAEMIRLAEAAAELHDEPDTKTLMSWVRRLPEEQRVPSPLRVASYCHNNATTHILERLFTGDFDHGGSDWLDKAKWCFNQMRTRDGGFELIKTTELVLITVEAELAGDPAPIESHFKKLGRAKTLTLLTALMRYDNSPAIVDTVQQHAIAAIPDIRHQLINVR